MKRSENLFDINTVEPRFNGPLYRSPWVRITSDFLQPGQNCSKMYGTEPRYNEETLDLTKSSL